MRESFTLYELQRIIGAAVEQFIPRSVWVSAEIADLKVNQSGHCYLELVERDEQSPSGRTAKAQARAVIWKSNYARIAAKFESATSRRLSAALKVLVEVNVTHHPVYGLSLQIVDIDPTYTVGDMERKRREILRQLEEEGVIDLNKELEMPMLPQRIAVISSATAAGYGDFCNQLANNPRGYGFRTELFPAIMQGERVEESILSALDAINDRLEEFDVVVIIRGGGATSDLSGFDTYLLAASCAQFPLPIITGIGHERDDTVIDKVAHTRVKTPTAAAEFLIAKMDKCADVLDEMSFRLMQGVRNRLLWEHRRIENLAQRIPSTVYKRIADAKYDLLSAQRDLQMASRQFLSAKKHRLELLQQRLNDALPEKQLARGYSITLKNGKAVKDASLLKEGDKLITMLHRGRIESEVKKK